MSSLILSRGDMVDLVTPGEVLALVEQAHADLADASSFLAEPAAMPFAGTDHGFIPMGAVSGRYRLAGVKLLADMPGNRARGLATQRSTVLLLSADTGECVAVLDGRLPTQLRTAATSAVATRHLARPDASVLGLIGAGALAVQHVRAIRLVRQIGTVLVWSRSLETVARFRTQVADLDVEVVAMPTAADVVSGAEILCTLTPAREPVVEGAWMTAGLHVNAVGAPPRPDHREIDTVGMKRATVVVDSRLTRTETGDLMIPLAEGALTDDDIDVELGDVITGRRAGRVSTDQITLFKSVGIGLQDVVLCQLLVERARAAGAGLEVDLSL
ncbi:alanine dehydrogenase [Nocardioides sp. AN3]